MKRLYLIASVIALLSISVSAVAEELWIEDDSGIADDEITLPLSASLTWNQLIGVNRDYPYYLWGFMPNLGYRNPLGFMVSATLPVMVELTNRGMTTYKHEMMLSDFSLGFSWPKFYTIPKFGIGLTAGTRFSFPTSKVAQYQTKRLGLSTNVGLSKSLWAFDLSYSLSFAKSFHESTTSRVIESGEAVVFDSEGHEVSAEIAAAEKVQKAVPVMQRMGNLLNTGRTNTSYAFTNMFALSYSITKELGLSFTFYVSNGRAYEVRNADERGERDAWGSETALNYTPIDYLSFSVGWATDVSMLRPDSKSYYNPIIETNGLDDMTLISFNITGSI